MNPHQKTSLTNVDIAFVITQLGDFDALSDLKNPIICTISFQKDSNLTAIGSEETLALLKDHLESPLTPRPTTKIKMLPFWKKKKKTLSHLGIKS